MKDKILRQIANGLSANVQRLNSPGLLEGKTGVAVYLYHYARYSGDTGYSRLADSLLSEITTGISKRDISLSTGLSGVGWGISHLLKERLIEDEDDLLASLDAYLLRHIREHTDEGMLDGCLYLMFAHPKPPDEPVMQVLAQQFSLLLSAAGYPLSVLNKLLAVASRMPDRHLDSWYDTLLRGAVQAIHTQPYRRSDLMICRDLLEAFPGPKDKQEWNALRDCCTSLLDAGISYADYIETVWQNAVFLGGASTMRHDLNRIATFVTGKLKDLTLRDLYLSAGLPAAGMDILSQSFYYQSSGCK